MFEICALNEIYIYIYTLIIIYCSTTPKTDYTYSKHSLFRRELAPGIVAMPNMSRPGLRTHTERINYMTDHLSYDSGDEIDYQLDSYRKRQYNKYMQEQQQSWYMRIITTIVTTITSAWTTVIGGGGGNGGGVATGYDSSFYRTKYGQEERGEGSVKYISFIMIIYTLYVWMY